MNSLKIYIKGLFYFLFILAVTSCSTVVLKLDEIPSNTPNGSPIYIAGNFNLWDPGDISYELIQDEEGFYSIELPRVYGVIEYKFTRGDWSTCEANQCGNDILNRSFQVGSVDSVYHRIQSWKDLDPINCDSITIIVKNIPKNTPKNEPIKIAGSFNAWNPGENVEYVLQKDELKNEYKVKVPRKSQKGQANNLLAYKFVREDITVAEVDKFGRDIDPRVLDFEKGDSVFVEIANWNDLIEPNLSSITIILTNIPSNTPVHDDIYIVGNFNDWNPGDDRYIFTKNEKRQYQISLPRKKYGLSFKITRGSWDTEFVGAYKRGLPNQDYNYDEIDTVYLTVEGWLDIERELNPYLTLLINKYPKNTPLRDNIFLELYSQYEHITPQKFKFARDINGYYSTQIKRAKLQHNYVINRGTYQSQEVDLNGLFVKPRLFRSLYSDTAFIQVDNWNDLMLEDKMVSIQITKIPKRTPEKDNFYITGQFNGWNPGDEVFRFDKNSQGNYEITIPLRYLKQGYKITRGNWQKVEGTKFKKLIENRIYSGNESNIKIEIEGWEDLSGF